MLASVVLLGSIAVQAWWIYRGYEQQKLNLRSQLSLALRQAVEEINTKEDIAFIARVGSEEDLKKQMEIAEKEAAKAQKAAEKQRVLMIETVKEAVRESGVNVSNSTSVSVISSDEWTEKEMDSLVSIARAQASKTKSSHSNTSKVSVMVSDEDGEVSTRINWQTEDSALLDVLEFQQEGRLTELIEKIERESMLAEKHVQRDVDTSLLASALHKSLENLGLNRAYEFSVQSEDSLVASITSPGFSKFNEEYTVSTRLFPFDLIAKDAHIKLQLTDSFGAIMKQLWSMIAVSVLFSVLMIGLFVFTIQRLLSQTRLSALKTDFINNMSHELKTPLATISLAADTLMLDSLSKEKAKEFAQTIKKEHHRIHDHIERVLHMAQSEKGKLLIEKRPIDVNVLLQEIVADLTLIVEERKANISFDTELDLPPLYADALHIRSAITNLIDNSLKYCTHQPHVLCKASKQRDKLHIIIEDNGIGMTEEQLQMAFDPFYRAETGNQQATKGFGLGLSYVKTVVEAHDGQISLQSQKGRGTSVNLEVRILSRVYSQNLTGCTSITHEGTTYYSDTTFSVVYTRAQGCDSTVTFNLNIQNEVDDTVLELEDYILKAVHTGGSYQWYRCDSNGLLISIAGATNQTLYYGIYNNWARGFLCKITNGACVQYSDCHYVGPILGSSDLKNVMELSLEPNPSRERVQIVNKSATTRILEYHVYDAFGQLVYSKSNLKEIGNQSFDLDGWASGFYVIHVGTSAGTAVLELIVAN